MMGIQVNEEQGTFHLYNEEISYVMALAYDRYLMHYYWGPRLRQVHQGYDYPKRSTNFAANPAHLDLKDRSFSLSTAPQEYPAFETGDHREAAYRYQDEAGRWANQMLYAGYEIMEGKPKLEGLPHTYAEKGEAQTLIIKVYDDKTGLAAELYYTIFNTLPIIARSVKFHNEGEETLVLERVFSASLDFPDDEYDLLQLPGAWARERQWTRSALTRGIHTLDSKRGTLGHNYQPFFALLRPETTEFQGEAYAAHLLYGGEFAAHIEVDTFMQTRAQIGISPTHFSWRLPKGGTFQTPECILNYSKQGLNHLSHGFHDLYNEHLLRGPYKHKSRPILLNNWEGTSADFSEEKIEQLMRDAKGLNMELFVLDDGWFGQRDDDYRSLGDWFVNQEKLPQGLEHLSAYAKAQGLGFGLWFEPEMISEDSDLYRKHPDWVLHTPGRPASRGRSQYVLDLSRPEVRENITQQLRLILDHVPIDYVKWDYNRNMTEIGSGDPLIPTGEVAHRFMLGLYELLEELVSAYPNILWESCSGGGGRFDASFLYYMPQTWTSDNSDAIARLGIQYGSSLCLPISAMTAHVSASPNYLTKRFTPLAMRGAVAMAGNLGYELDTEHLSPAERAEIQRQIAFYEEHRELVQFGRFYRLLNPYEEDQEAAWLFVDKEQEEALAFYYQILDTGNKPLRRLRLAGLDPKKDYQVNGEKLYGGDELMARGLYVNQDLRGDFQFVCLTLKAVKT